MPKIHSYRETGERYATLRVVGAACSVLGGFLLVAGALLVAVGLIGVTTDLIRPINGVGVGVALIWSIGLFASGLQALAFGAFVRLAIHVEENTRATAQALDKLRLAMDSKPEMDPRSIFLS